MIPIRFFTTLVFLAFSFTIIAQTPSNNNPDNAIELTVSNGGCSPVTGTLIDATHSGITYDPMDCTPSSVLNPTDIWYTVTVPASGNLTINTGSNIGEPSLVVVMFTRNDLEVYTRFNCVEFSGGLDSDDNIDNTPVAIEGRAAGEVLYFQVISAAELFGYGEDLDGTIVKFCAYEPSILDLPEPQKSMLSYYSNPVGNRLRLESPYDIQSLSVYDLAGREVLTKNPHKQKLTLDTYSLSSGVYMLNVQTAEGEQTIKLVKN